MSIIERFASAGTSLLCDALDECGFLDRYLGPRLRPIGHGPPLRFIGPAKTLLFRVRPRDAWFPEIPRERMIAGLERRERQVARGDVVVIACEDQEAPPYAILGDLGAANYKNLGVAAIVTSGFVRDVDEIARLELPVYAAGTSPVNGRGRAGTVAMDEPVVIHGVTISNGDLVVGDADGVIAIPADPELHRKILAYLDDAGGKETMTKEMIARGEMLSAAFARHGQL
jgi:5-oxopent-3-ene-1,2,5-tricarboxylate decarboxylase / 2-hydroxyhepta-2,4-diene-1,7-dioate isomerase